MASKRKTTTATPKHARDEEKEKTPCGQCRLPVLESDQSIGCEICNQWFHVACQKNLTKTKFEFLSRQSTNIHWYCDTCDITASTLLTTLASLKNNQEQMKKEMEEIKEKLSDEALHTRIDARINTIVSGSNKNEHIDMRRKPIDEKTIVNKSIKEMEQRKSRRPNMVIFQYPENKSQLRETRQKHDLDLIRSMENALEMDLETEICKIHRLGKIKEDSTRPLLVSFKDENTKRELFGQLQSLKECPTPLCDISVQHDMTPTERDESKELFDIAKSKQELAGGKWIFKVRGPPWAQKIIRVKPNPIPTE